MTLPTGTVTFLFTDIEGSSTLARRYPADLAQLLARHDAILRETIERHKGYIFQSLGDAFCAAFSSPVDAVVAAHDAQLQLQHEPWDPSPVRVRMGLHTGPAEAHANKPRGEEYSGYLTLMRAQRVMSAANGGQVILSNAAAELLRDYLPPGTSLVDLGEHRLKSLLQPEHLWQLAGQDLQLEFPPPQTLTTIPNNLPHHITSFFGRERETEEVLHFIAAHRLVTLTGSGGAGKTRLSLEVAAGALDRFTDGVWLVELAPLADAALVANAVAGALRLGEEPGRPILDTIIAHIRGKRLLLVIDNCEHLIEGAARFAEAILRGTEEAQILATSRERLSVQGELSWRVPSLATPESTASLDSSQVGAFAAVQLFADRARLVQPSFSLNDSNAAAVADICSRLDGIPLAIELAASRVRVLSVRQIAERLDDRFRLLVGGNRAWIPRHQTLRAAIDWSYESLSEPEQAFFRQLGVFSGGWWLDAAEYVTQGKAIEARETLDLLEQLIDKSLINAKDCEGETRYDMLETMREYALEKLRSEEEAELAIDRHLEWFCALPESTRLQARDELSTGFDRLEPDHDNLRSAMRRILSKGDGIRALKLCHALWPYWNHYSYLTESRHFLGEALAVYLELDLASREAHLEDYARGLMRYGAVITLQGDPVAGRPHLEEAAKIAQDLGHPALATDALVELGYCSWYQGDLETARNIWHQCVNSYRAMGDKASAANTEWMLGVLTKELGDYELAEGLFSASLDYFRDSTDKAMVGLLIEELAWLAILARDYPRSRRLAEESLRLREEAQEAYGLGAAQRLRGVLAWHEGDFTTAREALLQALERWERIGIGSAFICLCLTGLAAVDVSEGQVRRGVRLMGAIDADGTRTGRHNKDISLRVYEEALAAARSQLDAAAFEEEWVAGHELGVASAVALARHPTL